MFTTTRKYRSTQQTFTATAPKPEQSTARTFTEDPFRARFGHRLPRGLRQEARGMGWHTFMDTYCPEGGSIRLTGLSSERRPGGRFAYTATLDIDGRSETREITATGPVSAMTNLLADSGRRVEILEFHQLEIFEATATFLYTCHNNTRVWTMGFGPTAEASAMTAMVCAANRLHG